MEEDAAMTEINLNNFALTRGSDEAQAIKQLRRKYQQQLNRLGDAENDFLWGMRDALRAVIRDLDILLHDEDQ